MSQTMYTDFENDEPKEKCGVFGIYAPELDVSRISFFALVALQHRGQESCGIATCDERGVPHVATGMGLVSQVFNEVNLQPLKGKMAIGHTRYSTAGRSTIVNAQPVVVQTVKGHLAIAQNGNLTGAKKLKQILLERGVGMFMESDVEIITQMLAAVPSSTDSDTWESRIASFMQQADGAYSLTIMTPDAIYGVRDFLGMRPLCIGKITTDAGKTRYVICSETCAINTIGGQYIREVRPGEIVRIDEKGLHSFMGRPPSDNPAFCVFEYVYFARPDSVLEGQLVHKVRQRLGTQLAVEAPPPPYRALKEGEVAPKICVIGVPDSSLPAAIGYAKRCGLTYSEGLTKNRYIHRTFIQPSDYLRKLGVALKFNPLAENIRGKRIVLIDDSIVRGNTIKALVAMIRGAGAVEVHVRISSPPVKHPCFMGIDMATYEQLTSHNLNNEEVLKLIGADSLAYLTHEGMMKVVQEEINFGNAITETEVTSPTQSSWRAAEEKRKVGHCSACFTGEYPLQIDW